jgi:predicted nucleic acid-binding protein
MCLAGARSDQRELDLRRLLSRFALLRFDAAADFDAAARIYRRCRAVGFTPRGMVDCMFAAVAWRHGAALLAQDVDLQHLGQIIGTSWTKRRQQCEGHSSWTIVVGCQAWPTSRSK